MPVAPLFKVQNNNRLLTQLSQLRNRNLKISQALIKSQAHQSTSLFTRATMNQRGGQEKLEGGQEKQATRPRTFRCTSR